MSGDREGERITSDAALAFWEPRNDDGKPEMLVFGTGERIASTDRVFSGEAGALLLKWKREADAAVAKAAREMEHLKAEAERMEYEQRGGQLQ